jgi:acyl-CoA thioester hydrolase
MDAGRSVLSGYVHRRRVQFYETDAAGIVHFSWFFRYMEEAEHAMWRAAGLSIHPPGSPIGWARASATCDFKRPLRFEEEFDVTISIAAMSRKTIQYTCVLTKDGVTLATGAMTVICVRTVPNEPLKALDIPAEVAARFTVAAGEAGAVDAAKVDAAKVDTAGADESPVDAAPVDAATDAGTRV